MKRVVICLILLILITGCSNNKDIDLFLEDGFISMSNVVGSGYPSGYIFNDDNTFAYYVGETDNLPSNSLVSCRGTWKIKDNNLILTTLEEERNENPDDIWDNLIRNDKEYEMVFKDIKIIIEKDNKFLSTSNGNMYLLSVDEEYIKILYSLSKSYDEYYITKNKYYESI